jgi:hypothetical protein
MHGIDACAYLYLRVHVERVLENDRNTEYRILVLLLSIIAAR